MVKKGFILLCSGSTGRYAVENAWCIGHTSGLGLLGSLILMNIRYVNDLE